MNIKNGSKIYVPSTEAQGIVDKVEIKESDILVWVKWENFPVSYPYSYQGARHNWEITTSPDCLHSHLIPYQGINESYKYCADCDEKFYKKDS